MIPAGTQPANTNPMPTPSAAPAPVMASDTPPAPAPAVEPAPAPAVTPEPAPAAPVTPEPAPVTPDPGDKPTGDEPTGDPTPKFEYTPTGNEFMDSAAAVAMDAGLDPMQLAATIRESGDLSATDKAVLTAKIGEAHTNLLVKGFKSEIESAQSVARESVKAIHDLVGGEAVWKAIQEWSTTDEAGLTPEGEKAYNEMLQEGGIKAQIAAKELKEKYMQSPGFKESNPTMVQGSDPVPPAPAVEPISRVEYTSEYKKANRVGDAAKAAQLDARAKHTMTNHPDLWRPVRMG